MSVLAKNVNIPFMIKGDNETMKMLERKPSEKMIIDGKRNAKRFDTITVKEK